MAPAVHDMSTVYLLMAVTSACTITISFTLVIDNTLYSGSFDIFQANDKFLFSVGPARLVPRALNKQYSERHGLINVSFMYITVYYLGLLSEHL